MAYSDEARQYANKILEQRREYYLQETRRRNEEIRVKCSGFTELELSQRIELEKNACNSQA